MTHAPDGGLALDLGVMASRRRALNGFGLAGAALLLAACGDSEANQSATAADGSVCIKHPQETDGPFPADGTNSRAGAVVNVLDQEGVVRGDIRASFAGLTPVADGAKLDMSISLVDVGNACAPLKGHVIYIWHCDAEGRYSLYDLPEANYLRGAAVTDDRGEARFTTVFPGCYPGRWPHIHFEVFASANHAASGKESLLTSQFALPEEPCAALYAAHPAYRGGTAALAVTTLASDGVFRDNTPEQVVAQTLAIKGDPSAGFTASGRVGLSGA